MSEAHAARSARTRWLRPACTRACPFTAPPGQAHASDCPPTHTIVVFTRATAGVTCTAATRGGQRASDGRTPAAAQPRALAPVPQSGVQPPPAHGARCPGEQEARALGPASHMEARTPDAHRPRCARLPHSARSSALCAAHRPGTRPDCVQYQSDLRGACGPQDGGKLTENIDPGCHLAPVFFCEPFGVSLDSQPIRSSAF